jgi:hypothetical protein
VNAGRLSCTHSTPRQTRRQKQTHFGQANKLYYVLRTGRAIAQAVSSWLPTAAVQVRAQVGSCGICGEQSGAGAGFLRVLRFPLPILIPPTAPHSSSMSIVRGWYNRPVSGRRTKWTQSHLTPPQETKQYYYLENMIKVQKHLTFVDYSWT